MKPIRSKPIHSFTTTALCLAGIGLTLSARLQAEEVQVGRYSTVRALPTEAQANLLAARVVVQFPDRVTSVGEAVAHLLQSSGYRLARGLSTDPARGTLLSLPLPGVHRTLGPMSLQMALETLAGPSFRLVEDPVHRLISFELCADAPGVAEHRGFRSRRSETPRPAERRPAALSDRDLQMFDVERLF